MLLTPEIAKCPYCNTEHLYYQAMSGNTIGATFYSDGFASGSMYPDFKQYGKCSSCKKVFKLQNPTDNNGEDEKLPSLPDPDLYDFIGYLESGEDITADDERYIRTRIWWFFNDRIRRNQPVFSDNADKAIWKQNILVLISLTDNLSPESLLCKAELMRNLGRFRHSRSLLKGVKGVDYQDVKRQILKKCFQRQRKVFVIE